MKKIVLSMVLMASYVPVAQAARKTIVKNKTEIRLSRYDRVLTFSRLDGTGNDLSVERGFVAATVGQTDDFEYQMETSDNQRVQIDKQDLFAMDNTLCVKVSRGTVCNGDEAVIDRDGYGDRFITVKVLGIQVQPTGLIFKTTKVALDMSAVWGKDAARVVDIDSLKLVNKN